MLHLKHPLNPKTNAEGFTLIELMVALFVSALVMAATISVFISQSKSYSMQDDVANIQQDLRGALVIMEKEIRLAGCDPTQSHIPGFLVATNNYNGTNTIMLQFTRDIKGSGVSPNMANGAVTDADENITYTFTPAVNQTSSIMRQTINAGGTPTGFQSLADNIQALEFNYILANGTTSLAPSEVSQIRAVQVTILAKAANPTSDLIAGTTYTTPSGASWIIGADYYRRKFVTVTVECRNMWY